MKFVGWSARQSRRVSVGQAGFSLLEVLVCAFIVGIAAVGLALMFSSGQAFVQAEGDNRVALFLAQQRMEQIRAVGFSNLKPTIGVVVDPLCDYLQSGPCPQASPAPALPTRYTRKTSVVCVKPTDFASPESCPSPLQALRITVTVETPNIPKASPIIIETVLAEH